LLVWVQCNYRKIDIYHETSINPGISFADRWFTKESDNLA